MTNRSLLALTIFGVVIIAPIAFGLALIVSVFSGAAHGFQQWLGWVATFLHDVRAALSGDLRRSKF